MKSDRVIDVCTLSLINVSNIFPLRPQSKPVSAVFVVWFQLGVFCVSDMYKNLANRGCPGSSRYFPVFPIRPLLIAKSGSQTIFIR